MMKLNQVNILLLLPALAVAFVTIGCGGEQRPAGMPPLFRLTIHVTQEGQPLDDVTVNLVCPDGSMPWVIGAVTDSDGNATIMTQGRFAGAPEGTFRVTLQKDYMENFQALREAEAVGDSAAIARISPTVRNLQLIGDDYMSPTDTPLTVEVTRSTRTITVDAGPAVRIERPFIR